MHNRGLSYRGATFSLGSIITSLSFFGAAILVANILYMGKDKQIKQISYQED